MDRSTGLGLFSLAVGVGSMIALVYIDVPVLQYILGGIGIIAFLIFLFLLGPSLLSLIIETTTSPRYEREEDVEIE